MLAGPARLKNNVLQVLVEHLIVRLADDDSSSALTFRQLAEGIDMLEHARRLLWPQLVHAMTALDDLRLTDTQEAELASELERLMQCWKRCLSCQECVDLHPRRQTYQAGARFQSIFLPTRVFPASEKTSDRPAIIMTPGQCLYKALTVWLLPASPYLTYLLAMYR